jgi:hypothetical protein
MNVVVLGVLLGILRRLPRKRRPQSLKRSGMGLMETRCKGNDDFFCKNLQSRGRKVLLN